MAVEFRWNAPGPVAEKAFLNKGYFTGLRGPIGSGKTATMCVKLFTTACAQAPSIVDNVRRTRWAVVRNTSPELRTTTIKTWLDWFPEDVYGRMRWSPPFTHHIIIGDLDIEVIFLALDREEDVKKLLSLELTGIFFNEAREQSLTIITNGLSRTGRYPSMRHGGPSWYGGMADTNPPAHDHWWPIMSGETPPPASMSDEDKLSMMAIKGFDFFNQPPAAFRDRDSRGKIVGYKVNPEAENIQNLVPGYYESNLVGRTASWIKVYVLNELGEVIVGDPVFKLAFSRDAHVVDRLIPVDPELPLRIGIDFGIPAAIFGQKYPNNRWNIVHELTIGKSMNARRFARMLKGVIANLKASPTQGVLLTGDPKGQDSAQSDGSTAYQMFQAENLIVMPASTNDVALRLEAVEMVLGSLIEGAPAFQISSVSAPTLVSALETGYVYDKSGKPVKNSFSHVADALQYLLMGGGAMLNVLPDMPVHQYDPSKMKERPNPFSRLRRRGRDMRRSM